MSQPRVVVAIPVKDEAERIGACVRAVAAQRESQADALVLLINNSNDASADVVRALQPGLAVPLHVIEHVFPADRASAGAARRMAMEHAAGLLGENGALLTTDADGRVPCDWIAANLHYLRHGWDMVAGRVVLDRVEAARIPPTLHADDALEVAYAEALDEIAARLDPDPWDPWPRHSENAGASLAVRLEAYRRVGGMPAAPLAEDRRFVAALQRIDARIRHAPEIVVEVSGRTVGRAEGGMADTIRRRLSRPDPYIDHRLEPARLAIRRARVRRALRRARDGAIDAPALVSRLSGAPAEAIHDACSAATFGQAIELLEGASRLLRRRLVAAADVVRETGIARSFLEELTPPDRMLVHVQGSI